MDTENPPYAGGTPTYADLADMWSAHDPAPPGLAERALVALEMEDFDAEYELLHIIERGNLLVGTRAAGAPEKDVATETLTIVFSGNSCSLMLRVGRLDDDHRRVDGWVSPPRSVQITLKQQKGDVQVDSDARGRFEVARMPAGLTRAALSCDEEQPAGQEQLFATPAFEL